MSEHYTIRPNNGIRDETAHMLNLGWIQFRAFVVFTLSEGSSIKGFSVTSEIPRTYLH
jgi:hypothetical protein